MKKKLIIAVVLSIFHLKAQETWNYELVDAFRIDKNQMDLMVTQ